MEELTTALYTVIGGTLVYTITKLIETHIIEPKKEYKELLSKIAYDMVYYADVVHNPGVLDKDEYIEATKELREKAAMLKSYSLRKPIFLFKSKKKMQECASYLIGLSNSVDAEWTLDDKNAVLDYEKHIKKYLRLD